MPQVRLNSEKTAGPKSDDKRNRQYHQDKSDRLRPGGPDLVQTISRAQKDDGDLQNPFTRPLDAGPAPFRYTYGRAQDHAQHNSEDRRTDQRKGRPEPHRRIGNDQHQQQAQVMLRQPFRRRFNGKPLALRYTPTLCSHYLNLAFGRFRRLDPSTKHAAGCQAGLRARVSLPPSSCPRPASCAASILEWPNPAPATKLGQSRDEPPANSGRGVVPAADKGQACPEDVWRIARRVRS